MPTGKCHRNYELQIIRSLLFHNIASEIRKLLQHILCVRLFTLSESYSWLREDYNFDL